MERTQPTSQLTERQREVLRLVERGHTNSEIADKLGISLQGVKWHVRELLTKFNADTREDLIESREAERAPMARVGRWLSAIGGFGIPKASAAAVFGGGAVVASVAIAGAVLAARGGASQAASEPDAVQDYPTATPAAVAFVPATFDAAPMPTVAGAIWTPSEALTAALDQATAEMLADNYGNDLDPRPDLNDFTVTRFEWRPSTTDFDLPGGDLYWDNDDGGAHNLWWVRWEASGLATTPNVGFRIADVVVDLLLEDGNATAGIRAIRLGMIDPASGIDRLGSADGFRSHEQDAQVQRGTQPVAPTVHLAWENGIQGSKSLGGYPTAEGTWCYTLEDATWMCSFKPEAPFPAVNYRAMSSRDAAGTNTSYRLVIQVDVRVARVQIIPGDGRILDYELTDPPAEVPVGSRFALIELGSSPGQPVVIGYDAAGNEVIRRNFGGIDPPPGAGPPPPPPTLPTPQP